MKSATKTILAIALSAFFVTPLTTSAQGSTQNRREIGKTINITGSEISQTINATGNENINIMGADVKLVVTGTCNSINITGADVRVQAEGVRSVRIVGADSGVTYTFSPNKNGKAVVSVTGADSYVRKLE